MKETEQIKAHYNGLGIQPLIIIKTKYKFKWGLPFPFIVLTDDSLDIIAIKQRNPKLYRSISRKELLYARLSARQLAIVLAEEEVLIALDEQADLNDAQLLLTMLK